MAYTTIDNSLEFFAQTLYTGNSTARTITTGMQADLLWIKQRSTVRPNVLFDTVNTNNFAGGNSKYLVANTDGAITSNNSTQITGIISTGFTMGADNSDQINGNGDTAVAWTWKANGVGSSDTTGSINSTKTSANATSKCSIVTYTGSGSNATVGHGLGVVPASIWVKCTSNAGEDWMVFHKAIGATHYLTLNTTAGDNSGGEVIWNDTLPTSSVFSIGTNGKVNTNGRTYVAYLFAEVKGFSQINRYFGNGQADGAYTYTGFRPGWIMIKRADAAGDNWLILDAKRQGYNGGSGATQGNLNLTADQGASEGNETLLDIYSNGYKIKTADAKINGSGNGYTYWAFAENPFVTSTGIPTPAR